MLAVRRQQVEVAVVARGLDRRPDSRRHEPVGRVGNAQRQLEHCGEVLGEDRDTERPRIDGVQLGVVDEPAEAAVARVEQLADLGLGARVGHADVTAHRPERGHDPPLWTAPPPPVDGAIDAWPKSKVELEVAEDSSLVLVEGLEAAWLPGCEARAATANATNPATAVTPIARRANFSALPRQLDP